MNISNVDNKDLPAFASVAISGSEGYQQDGLTKLEYFAAAAMSGILSNEAQIDTTDYKWVAKNAIGYAKSLLEELEQKSEV